MANNGTLGKNSSQSNIANIGASSNSEETYEDCMVKLKAHLFSRKTLMKKM